MIAKRNFDAMMALVKTKAIIFNASFRTDASLNLMISNLLSKNIKHHRLLKKMPISPMGDLKTSAVLLRRNLPSS
jgi:hypothetical protein